MIADLSVSPPTLVLQDTYYAMGHFSRFLPEGATRIGLQYSGGSSTLEWTAFQVYLGDDNAWARQLAHERAARDGLQPSGSEVVVIVFNPTTSAQALVLQAGDWFVRVAVPAHSFHTLSMDAAIFGNNTQMQSEKAAERDVSPLLKLANHAHRE